MKDLHRCNKTISLHPLVTQVIDTQVHGQERCRAWTVNGTIMGERRVHRLPRPPVVPQYRTS